MTRKAWLEGDRFNFDELTQHFATGDVRVVRDAEEDGYYLTAPEIDAALDDHQANEIIARIISRINVLGRILESNFRPVKLSRYTDDTGKSVITGTMAATVATVRVRLTGTVTYPDGTTPPSPPSPWPDYLALAATNPDVTDVLERMDKNHVPLGWGDLFKIHEKIQDSINGSIPKMGWASKADDDAFGASANRSDVSGKDARHARTEKGPPPKRTMTIQQGREYIRDIVAKWLDYLR